MLDISMSSVEKLHQHQIYPIVLLIKFKSTKQIKEVKDTRYTLDKLSGKAAKEMFEHGQKLELEYRHQITGESLVDSSRGNTAVVVSSRRVPCFVGRTGELVGFSAVIPAGVNIAYMCTQVKAAIEAEHNKSQWVPVQ